MRTAAACLALALVASAAHGFVVPAPAAASTRSRRATTTVASSSSSGESAAADRKGFLQQLAGVGLGLAASTLITTTPAPALAAGVAKVNSQLASYGLPPILDVPGGFTPLVEIYGKTAGVKKERETLLVQFLYPSLWVVSRPSIDKNGEEGTISAGDYQKGDSAAFFVGEGVSGGNLEGEGEDYFGKVVERAISQKSQNVYQNFKVTKKPSKGAKGSNGAQYYIVEFKYELLTGAGFTVDRRGVASITQVGKNVQALVAATTATRYKKLKDDLLTMAESFRVYDGVAPN